jgi:tape measure domain-containing protein|nr:MAG TPA: tail tape measure protein [Caudoviricetes sp.]
MADGYLNFDTKINEAGFNKGISKLSNIAQTGLGVVVGNIATSAMQKIGQLGSELVAGLNESSAAWKTFQANMQMNGKTADEISKIKGELKDFAEQTIYSASNMASTYSQLEAVGTKNTTALVKGFGGLAAAASDPTQAMKTLSQQATQMAAKPKVAWEDFRFMLEQTPAGMAAVAKQLGMSATEMVARVKDGELATEDFFDAIAKVGTNDAFTKLTTEYKTVGQATDGLIETLTGQLQPAFDTLSQVGINAISGITDKISAGSPIIEKLTTTVNTLVDKLNSMSTEELVNLAKMGGLLVTAVPALAGIGKGMEVASTASGAFTSALSGIGNGVKSIPGKFDSAKKSIGGLGKSFGTLGSTITGPFDVMMPKVTGSVRKIGSTVASLPGKIVSPIGKIGKAVAGKFPGITSAFSDFTGYLGAWGGNVGSALSGVLGNVGKFMPGFAKLMNFGLVAGVLVAGLGLLNTQFGEQINTILTTMQLKGPEVITNFCNGIVTALPNLIAQGGQILNNLMLAITANLPAIIQGGIAIISSLISGIAQQLPTLIPTAVNMILTLATSLLSNIDQIIDAGIDLLVGLAQGLVNALPQLINKAPTIIGQLASAIIRNLPKILQAGIKILGMLATGLIQAVPQLISKIPSIISQIKNAFTSIDWGTVGSNIIKGIASGLKSAGGAIVEAAKNAAKSALNAAKDFLGIHSPSRVFRDQVGKMMALGMGIGFDKNVPIKSMNASLKTALGSLKENAGTVLSGGSLNRGGVGRMKALSDATDGIDYDRLERIQMKAADKMAKRPIYLDKNRIDKPLPKGAVPVW